MSNENKMSDLEKEVKAHKQKILAVENDILDVLVKHDCSFAEAKEAIKAVERSLTRTFEKMFYEETQKIK